ncbi:hypothetical protein [Marinobacter sp. LV10MA510-1]|uniref:nSTAND3 domain-containing NTPase n=1 Tax=Marinobacter sp. LV10MA510-1 TaxID=1415567 RepID=UPI000BF57B51|nr:hypothetical protein [Marinobacter sp. LV10MA510-1]
MSSLNQAHYARSGVVHERLLAEAKTYVASNAKPTIVEQLVKYHCCSIAGNLSLVKITTARQIALQLQIQTPNAELIWVDDRNFRQALQLIRPQTSQIMVLDDLLGAPPSFMMTACWRSSVIGRGNVRY